MANIDYNPSVLQAIFKKATKLKCIELCGCDKLANQNKIRLNKYCHTGNKLQPVLFCSKMGRRPSCKTIDPDEVNKYMTADVIDIFCNIWAKFCDEVKDNIILINPESSMFFEAQDEYTEKTDGDLLKFYKEVGLEFPKYGMFGIPMNLKWEDCHGDIRTINEGYLYVLYYIPDPLHYNVIGCKDDGCLWVANQMYPSHDGEWDECKDNLDGDYGDQFKINDDYGNNKFVMGAITAHIKLKDYLLFDGREVNNGGVITRSATGAVFNKTGLTLTIY